ncbi:LysR family transcriptional regulator [Paraburkholderia unamae]|uniref:LysR family transcriptional regulator n=1 Tax=Paraburkholderia unamae TaxID=219649 RepID=A0ABX5K968_9BURK|nr:LysR family transcriptional regulator [Paraburkholderia unamae]PVX71226.1 LysR family transcriptional regulator [Paraburkholderia unamae]RAR65275.1 LysR family transcriptional regulator [Paraburkholderia unamae]CAG9273639.1 LysR family transcriptional regulator [Paraburkholderia unamae]
MDKLTSMTVFVKTAESGSFTAAARLLAMTPQMAGKHVDALEKELGVRLLHRSTRKHALTEAGRAYFEACRRVLEEAAAADAVALAQTGHPRGTLRVTAPVAFGTYRLAHEIKAFLAEFPDVKIDLVLGDRQIDLLQDGFDVAFRIGALADSQLVARPLAPYRLVPCAAPAYLAAFGTPTHPRELAQHVCLDYAFESFPAPYAWAFMDGATKIEVEPRSQLRCNDGRALIAAAEAGLGIVLAGEPNVAQSVAAGRLVPILEGYAAPMRPMHLLYVDRRAQAPKQRAFVEWALARFGAAAPAGPKRKSPTKTPRERSSARKPRV